MVPFGGEKSIAILICKVCSCLMTNLALSSITEDLLEYFVKLFVYVLFHIFSVNYGLHGI